MPLFEQSVKSWKEFVEFADGLDLGEATGLKYAFRGQANVEWKLEPTLVREIGYFSPDQAHKLESRCLREFQSRAHLFKEDVGPDVDPLYEIAWWMLMHHHGAPTRLLDWCKSIYVAAYFAAIDHSDDDGAIWLVNVHTVHERASEAHGGRVPTTGAPQQVSDFLKSGDDTICFVERELMTSRMVAQQGVFSLCGDVLRGHDGTLDDIFRDWPPGIYDYSKIVVPRHCKHDFLKRLREMNITASSLFPGLDGLGRSMKEIVRLVRGR